MRQVRYQLAFSEGTFGTTGECDQTTPLPNFWSLASTSWEGENGQPENTVHTLTNYEVEASHITDHNEVVLLHTAFFLLENRNVLQATKS